MVCEQSTQSGDQWWHPGTGSNRGLAGSVCRSGVLTLDQYTAWPSNRGNNWRFHDSHATAPFLTTGRAFAKQPHLLPRSAPCHQVNSAAWIRSDPSDHAPAFHGAPLSPAFGENVGCRTGDNILNALNGILYVQQAKENASVHMRHRANRCHASGQGLSCRSRPADNRSK